MLQINKLFWVLHILDLLALFSFCLYKAGSRGVKTEWFKWRFSRISHLVHIIELTCNQLCRLSDLLLQWSPAWSKLFDPSYFLVFSGFNIYACHDGDESNRADKMYILHLFKMIFLLLVLASSSFCWDFVLKDEGREGTRLGIPRQDLGTNIWFRTNLTINQNIK